MLLVETMGDAQGPQRFQLAAAQRLAGDERLALETLAGVLAARRRPAASASRTAAMGDGEFQFVDVRGELFQGQFGLDAFAVPQARPVARARWGASRGRCRSGGSCWPMDSPRTRSGHRRGQGQRGYGAAGPAAAAPVPEADRLLRELAEKAEPPQSWFLQVRRAGHSPRAGRRIGRRSGRRNCWSVVGPGDEKLAQTSVYSAAPACRAVGPDSTSFCGRRCRSCWCGSRGAEAKEARTWASALGSRGECGRGPGMVGRAGQAASRRKRSPTGRSACGSSCMDGFPAVRDRPRFCGWPSCPDAAAKERVEGACFWWRGTCALLDRHDEAVLRPTVWLGAHATEIGRTDRWQPGVLEAAAARPCSGPWTGGRLGGAGRRG